MSNQQSADADGRVIHTLRAFGRRLDRIPDRLTADATAAFSARTVDKELAAFSYDSLLDDPPGGGAPNATRHLTFVSQSLSVELDIGENGLRGHLVPSEIAEIEVRWPGGSTTAMADEAGDFSMPTIPSGSVSLRCRRSAAGAASLVVTDWVTL